MFKPIAKRETQIPIRLITKDSSNNLKIENEGLNYIQSIEGNIAVCICVGPYRQGKSYLLNRILDQTNSFEVGHTVNACTKGIWVLKSEKKLYDENNKEFTLLTLDTEVNFCI
jgi:hypothetical protein